MGMDPGSPLDLVVKGAAATLTLNRPDRRNAIDAALIAALHRSLDVIERSPEVRVLRLGHRGPWFCSGMDFEDRDDRAEPAANAGEFFAVLERIACGDVVSIAVVGGQVAGGGVGLVAACDTVLASSDATFSLPEALWGLLPAAVYPFLRRRIGPGPARHLALSAGTLTAADAARLGLVDEVNDRLENAATAATRRSVRIDRETIARIKTYTNTYDPLPADARTRAATALAGAMQAPGVAHRIERWTQTGRLPWE
ncbi:enoyl-CoA hydratase-related protein [Nocardia sp. XZ_19_369]|uniref:enoyl-CoA hydratase-related protein n=1 Tax=Nocardia sp. XZ_19_369 TaxID=2769487 RepID=UPI00188EABAF|nr:enoyl-CoA hydratase-related protein [Nocardia sp. XZ_19_369]